MNEINFQKTYKGKTAGQWLKNAKIAEMMAGTVEVVVGDFLAIEATDNRMVLNDGHGTVIGLVCGPRAAEKLAEMTIECERRMQDRN